MKNIQTGNEIEITTIGSGLTSVTSYSEIIEIDRSWVYCSVAPNGEYFAQLQQDWDAIVCALGENCVDDALSALENKVKQMRESGDERSILKWNAPQTLGV